MDRIISLIDEEIEEKVRVMIKSLENNGMGMSIFCAIYAYNVYGWSVYIWIELLVKHG